MFIHWTDNFRVPAMCIVYTGDVSMTRTNSAPSTSLLSSGADRPMHSKVLCEEKVGRKRVRGLHLYGIGGRLLLKGDPYGDS